MDIEKRWQRKHERWARPTDRPLFVPADYRVDVIKDEEAGKAFTVTHHYSGSWPAKVLAVGLYAARSAQLVGTCVFAQGGRHTVSCYTGLPQTEGCELARFVLLDSVGYNGETYFLARALRMLRQDKPRIRAIVSFADPLERRDPLTAQLLKAAHYGRIYQASNATYAGRSRARWVYLAPAGTGIDERTYSKVRGQEQGWQGAVRQMERAGAAPRAQGEDYSAWLKRVLELPPFSKVRNPGKFAYTFGQDKAIMPQLRQYAQPGGYPRPERTD